LDILNPQRNDGNPFVHRSIDFFRDLRRLIGVIGEQQHHDLCRANRFDDRLTPLYSSENVARGDPAANALLLQTGTHGIRNRFVVRAITDKNVVHFVPLQLPLPTS